MAQQLVEKMLPLVAKMQWAGAREPTLQGRKTYEVGVEQVEHFRSDPKDLAAALRIFQTSDSLPYAYAGVAYTLVAAAREADGSYAKDGLDAALKWLERAQEAAPDQVEINVIESLIYIHSGRFRDARLILDYLEAQEPDNYYLVVAETYYWQQQGNLEQAVASYQRAMDQSATVPQKLRAQARLGDYFFQKGLLDRALEVYKEAVHFDRQNPWLWHNLSIIYFRQENYQEAGRCNVHALTLADFPPMRQMEAALKQKLGTGHLKRLFGG